MRCFTALLAVLIAAWAMSPSAVAQNFYINPNLQHPTPTSMVVMWESDGLTGPHVVRYGNSANALANVANAGTRISPIGTLVHHARLHPLTPDTRYFYRTDSGGNESEVYSFRTPPRSSEDTGIRFLAYSDMQGGPDRGKHAEVVSEGMIPFIEQNWGNVLEDEVGFVMIPGDLVVNGGNYAEWKDQFFDESHPVARHVPYMPALGNHDYFNGAQGSNGQLYLDYFDLPTNGTPGYLERWWWADMANVRVIALDSNSPSRISPQLDWLEQVLFDAELNEDIDFVFAQLHHPHLSPLWIPGNTDYTRQVVEILEDFTTRTGKPSVHFFGHTHGYERGQSRDHRHMYVNVSAGEGGIDYWGGTTPVDYPEFQRVFPTWGFVAVEVTAGNDPAFRLRRVSRGNDVAPVDNAITDDVTIRRFNTAPAQPTPVLPVDGAVDINPVAAQLQGTPFFDADAGDFHAEAEYQLTIVSGDYAEPISHWVRFENWFAPEGASGRSNGYFSVNTVEDPDVSRTVVDNLQGNTQYFWRVRYRDQGLQWSDWSAEASFTTTVPPPGACCLPVGGCQQLSEAECAAQFGTWDGAGTGCADTDCEVRVLIFEEDFDRVPLGPSVVEAPLPGDDTVWTNVAPEGWDVTTAATPTGGMPEWFGWTFAQPDWWAQVASDQGRSGFESASGAIAVADPDEYDDFGAGLEGGAGYDSGLRTPWIDITGALPSTLVLEFNSSWQPEDAQRARVFADFGDGQGEITVLTYTSVTSDANFKDNAVDERVRIALPARPDTNQLKLRWVLDQAGNDWWWAIDNVIVTAQPAGLQRVWFSEDFESVTLGPSVDEALFGSAVWSDTPPAGWNVDDSGVPTLSDPTRGVTEWEGWAFVDLTWWAAVDVNVQQRDEFTRGTGVIVVADPDEWDDRGLPRPESLGDYRALLTTPEINVIGLGDEALLSFDSSWRPEDTQRARVLASYDGEPEVVVMDWTSTPGENFKPAAVSELAQLPLQIPAGTSVAQFVFELRESRNDWWWAIDNVRLLGPCIADAVAPFGSSPDSLDLAHFLELLTQGAADDLDGSGAADAMDLLLFLNAVERGCGTN